MYRTLLFFYLCKFTIKNSTKTQEKTKKSCWRCIKNMPFYVLYKTYNKNKKIFLLHFFHIFCNLHIIKTEQIKNNFRTIFSKMVHFRGKPAVWCWTIPKQYRNNTGTIPAKIPVHFLYIFCEKIVNSQILHFFYIIRIHKLTFFSQSYFFNLLLS